MSNALMALLAPSTAPAPPAQAGSRPAPGPNPLASALDCFAAALCVVESDRHVVFMNRSARQAAARRDGFVLRDGYLHGARLESTQRLDRALKAICVRDLDHDAFQIRRTDHVDAIQVSVSRLGDASGAGRSGFCTALVAASTVQAGTHAEATLRALFGLSRSEAAILRGMLMGSTLEQCAASRGVALSTVRSQLSSIFGKTGTTHQAQLVALARSLPALAARLPDGPCGNDWVMV